MVRFIKLTNIILNAKHITQIVIKPKKYYIYIRSSNSKELEYEVCEDNNPIDYKIVSEWIDKI
jgi:hypothetical protein